MRHEPWDKLRECKDSYRRKQEAKPQKNNMREMWIGMMEITVWREKQADTRQPGDTK